MKKKINHKITYENEDEMTKKEEEWTVHDIVVISAMCCLCYGTGIVLLYIKSLLGLGLIIIPTLFIIPALIDAKKKLKNYLKERRRIKRLLDSEQIIIGGAPQKHHKKKKWQPAVFDYPIIIDDETSKGKMMQELGLWYEKPAKLVSFEEKKVNTVTSQKHERTNKLGTIFDTLEAYGKIRFSYQAHVGALRGKDIGRFVKIEAKRRGLDVTVKEKGKDVIISMAKRSGKTVV